MTNLKSAILAKCELDDDTIAEWSETINEGFAKPCESIGERYFLNKGIKSGAGFAQHSLLPIIRALLDDREELLKALKNECCCPGETSWITGIEVLCDACASLTASNERMKKLGEG